MIKDQAIKKYIEQAIGHANLSDKEEQVIRGRYGLYEQDRTPLTLDELGARLFLTKGRVRQIQLGALRKIKFYIDDAEYADIEKIVAYLPWFKLAVDVFLAAHPRMIMDGINGYNATE